MSKKLAQNKQITPDSNETGDQSPQWFTSPLSSFLNPHGNAAQIEAMKTQQSGDASSISKNGPGKPKEGESPNAETPWEEKAGFFSELDEKGQPVMYKLEKPIITKDEKGNPKTITEFSGAELNLMGRTIYGESSGSEKVPDANTRQDERNAVGSTILNRLGASHLKGGKKSTIKGVLDVPGQYRAVTGNMDETQKFRNSQNSTTWNSKNNPNKTDADLTNLKESMDTVRGLLKTGPTREYTHFNSLEYAKKYNVKGDEDIGGTRFWKDPNVKQ